MSIYGLPRPTPWVWRLIIANAVVLLLLTALLPALEPSLLFVPNLPYALTHPWTFGSYMFVHAGLLHLAFNMLDPLFAGHPGRGADGRPRLHPLLPVLRPRRRGLLPRPGRRCSPAPIAGASAAVLGVAVAFAMFWPDAELMVFPLPWPIRARTLVIVLLALDLVLGLAQPRRRRRPHRPPRWRRLRLPLLPPPGARRPGAPAAAAGRRAGRHGAVGLARGGTLPTHRVPRPRRRIEPERDEIAVETDRLLDKISGQGIAQPHAGGAQIPRRGLEEEAALARRNLTIAPNSFPASPPFTTSSPHWHLHRAPNFPILARAD